LLTQDALIFEHMSVLDNVAYGPRCHGLSRAQAQKVAYVEYQNGRFDGECPSQTY
jgi:ABC-type sulfate/molybdate transport systems ATPase subunit